MEERESGNEGREKVRVKREEARVVEEREI